MSDSHPIEPVAPVEKVAPVSAIYPTRAIGGAVDTRVKANAHVADSTTGGGLRAAYAQFVVDPNTQDIVIRIRDSATDEVLRELPSPEVEAMRAHLNTYVQKLALFRASHGTPHPTTD